MAIMTPQRGGMTAQPDWFQQFQNLNQNPPTWNQPGPLGPPQRGVGNADDQTKTVDNPFLSAPGAQSGGDPNRGILPGGNDTPGWPTGDPTDPAAFLQAYVYQHQNDPDFDPSLKNDPQYWIKVINENGGLGDPSKQAYWSDKFKTARGQSGSPAGGNLYSLGQGSMFAPFQRPTAEDALNSPGYQFALDQGLQGIQRSAAAKGTLLTGGTLKALSRFGVGTALQDYNNLYNQNYNQFNDQRNFQRGVLNDFANRGVASSQ